MGESNRYLDLFTEDFGLVRGIAQGVRKLESKLRYGLQDLSYSKLSLVKGREVWRIVNVEKLNVFDQIVKDKKRVELTSRIFSLVRRLVRGEEKDSELFNDVNSALFLMATNDLVDKDLKNFEAVLVYRILHRLGYIPESLQLSPVVIFDEWRLESFNIDSYVRTAMVRQINDSLLHSHL
ncbi:MAG: DNA repair protein RecO [Candidatus Vogelbacteria bacterium]|nr:DNA repair protein RecO [Candidatus Vogelbacteria bacterium]